VEFHRRERLHGDFSRAMALPFRVNAEGVDAKLNHGVLVVKLPRAEEDKPRKISVKAA
jgi:HSP20 family protein